MAGLSPVLTTSRDAPAARRAKASSPPRFSLNRGFATAELHHMGLDEDASNFCDEAHSFLSRHPTGEEAFRARGLDMPKVSMKTLSVYAL